MQQQVYIKSISLLWVLEEVATPQRARKSIEAVRIRFFRRGRSLIIILLELFLLVYSDDACAFMHCGLAVGGKAGRECVSFPFFSQLAAIPAPYVLAIINVSRAILYHYSNFRFC